MFKFKGISSDSMKIIVAEEEHFLARAGQKIETLAIDGRDGALYENLGYLDVEKIMKIQILDISKVDEIFDWLNGEGVFEYKGRVTVVKFYNEISPVRTCNIKTAEVNFIRGPFWSKANDEYENVTSKVTNLGNIQSRPIIRLEKNTSNNVELTIGQIRFKYNFNNEDYVEIDCEDMSVKYNNLQRNRFIEIGYEYPILKIGINDIVIHAGNPRIKIKRKDRWL